MPTDPVPAVRMRPALNDDCALVFAWANDPVTLAASAIGKPIEWEEHRAWFAARLNDPLADLFIALDLDDAPCGFLRFQTDSVTEISVNVDPSARGQGLGVQMIRMGCDALFEAREVDRIVAYVKADNAASVRAFVAAGFVAAGSETVRGAHMLRFELVRVP